jgi:hypothetical protein
MLLRIAGGLLVAVGAFAILVFGLVLLNYDASTAGPGTEDPTRFGLVGLALSIGVVAAGLWFWRRGRAR